MLIPLEKQIACVERELAKRLQVYPRLIEAGKMTEVQAQYEVSAMEAVRETLRALLAREGSHGQMPLL